MEPVICFGQQPNGFFPKRFFVAKIRTAQELQKQIGGKIVMFYHDSDADYRETITILNDRQTNAEVRLNFTQENKIQKNFSPLYLKRIPENWNAETRKQLPRFISSPSPKGEGRPVRQSLSRAWGEGIDLIELFTSVQAGNVADFCLEMYKKLEILNGIEIARSSDKNFRQTAVTLSEDIYADVPYENEVVRAKILPPNTQSLTPNTYTAQLHHGGGKFTEFEVKNEIKKEQITPGRDQRFLWMNSVIKATHYITGNSEYDYLKREEFPKVEFIKREQINNQDLAWLPN